MGYQYITPEIEEYIVKMRRYFHENPELSWEEVNTQKKLKEELESMGLEPEIVAKTGLIAVINPEKDGPCLAIRADIDALPVTEENNLEFASKNTGVMHACGHDSHMAMLLGAAKSMVNMKDKLGKVVLLFQPAEEFIKDSGAAHVVKEGALEKKGVDRIISIHIWNQIESGKATISPGPLMASADTFKLVIKGKGGHGAQPHTTIDPIPIGALIVENFQHLISRVKSPMNPQVLSVTAFNAGNTENVIPDNAVLLGTCRAFDNDLRDRFPQMMEKVIKGICEANGADYEFTFYKGTPATINEEESAILGNKIAKDIMGEENVLELPPQMVGEDFAKYLVEIPGCMMLLGGKSQVCNTPHHSATFMIEEDNMKTGAEYFVRYALEYTNK
ncbi:MAG: M20 family metallopeptidase [Tissierellia bacterium]|nr:M20 family metallopeptidase [Tissierellia bacterium]